MGIPLGLASAAQFSTTSVLVAFVGKMVGVNELGATSLAFGLINATALAFAGGFCGALETMLSYSYGRDPHSTMYGTYAQRMVVLLLIVAMCLGPIIAYADALL
uniref:Multidrug and toxin extrusion protein 1 n=1 Tax=Lygus hesperus TaxID=30085 RepID=A0A0A9ZE40_LYGHE